MRTITVISIVILCIVGTSTVYSQAIISNKLTKGHVLVRGTKISMIPPKGFTNAPNFRF